MAYAGVNSIGLKRRGFDQARVNHIQDIYRILFVKGHNINKALEEVEIHIPESEDKHTIVQFVQAAERGLLKGYNQK